ncbi:MAG: hypothetical protein FWC91_12160 [Defluviitaleaceae bacterium]|nr:hypothetical protein [Defluviitaleaceae bacterium]
MNKIIMGIDGGGTKSHLGLFDLNGKCLGFYAHGTLNHEMLPRAYEQLEEELKQFICGALDNSGANINDIACAVIGLAGVDTQEQHQIISAILKRIGLEHFVLCNDGYLGVSAGCPNGVGICAINGTGSVLTAIDTGGKTYQIGGIGGVTDDRGGSSWYATQVLGVVYSELFKSASPTVISKMLFSKLNINHRDLYIEAVTTGMETNIINYSDLNRLVFAAANEGDSVANRILKESAEHYARCIEFLANNLDFPVDKPLYVTLAGSVFIKEKIKILPTLIKERVRALLSERHVEFLSLEAPPVIGAVMWAFREIDVSVDVNQIQAAFAKHL